MVEFFVNHELIALLIKWLDEKGVKAVSRPPYLIVKTPTPHKMLFTSTWKIKVCEQGAIINLYSMESFPNIYRAIEECQNHPDCRGCTLEKEN
jgi:hypothetical protein